MRIWRIVFMSVMACFMFYICGINVHAETFSGLIEDVPKTDSAATFIFDFSERQQYEVTLIDPNGDIYNQAANKNKIEIEVKDAPGGDYTYTIEAEKEEFTYNVKVTDVGKTVASVGESNPTITENVSDLQIYFSDGDLVATWKYSGKVSITVMDPSRFNYLESKYETTATEYRKKIDDNVKSIQFYIVPSVDAKVPGAGLTYTRDVVRTMDAKMDFPDFPVVNKDVVTVPITVNEDGVSLKIYNNNFTVGASNHNDDSLSTVFSDKIPKGSYEIDIPLVSIDNNIVACFVDAQGNAITYSYTYVRDMQAPLIDPAKLSLDNQAIYTNYSTVNNMVLISGTITDDIATDRVGEVARFTIDGYDVPLDNSGRFSFEHQLVLGVNSISLVATDTSGNQSELIISVTMTEKESAPIELILFIGVVVFLGALVVVTVIVKLRGRGEVPPKSPTPPKKNKNKPTKNESKTEKKSAMIANLKASARKQDEDDGEEVSELDEQQNNIPKQKLSVTPKNSEYKPILAQISEKDSKSKFSFGKKNNKKAEQKALEKQRKKAEKRSRYEKENNVIVEDYDDGFEEKSTSIPKEVLPSNVEKTVETSSKESAFVKKGFVKKEFAPMTQEKEQEVVEPKETVVETATNPINSFSANSFAATRFVSATAQAQEEYFEDDYDLEDEEEYEEDTVEDIPNASEDNVGFAEEIVETVAEDDLEEIVEESAQESTVEEESVPEVVMEDDIMSFFEPVVEPVKEEVASPIVEEVAEEVKAFVESKPVFEVDENVEESVITGYEEEVIVQEENVDEFEDSKPVPEVVVNEHVETEEVEEITSNPMSASDFFDKYFAPTNVDPEEDALMEAILNEELEEERAKALAEEIDEEECLEDDIEEEECLEENNEEEVVLVEEDAQEASAIIEEAVPEVVETPVTSVAPVIPVASLEDEYEDEDYEEEDYEEDVVNEPIVEEKTVAKAPVTAPRKVAEPKKTVSSEKKFVSPIAVKVNSKKVEKESSKKSTQATKMNNIRTISTLVRFTVQAACVVAFFTVVVRNTVIASGSMEPTLMTGDIALYNKLAYEITDVQRGDIIAFWSDESQAFLAKRVIGLGGDTIEFHDGYVFINGFLADESLYLDENVETNCSKSFTVPEGCVFVLGDNRDNSLDSRYFLNPYIPLEDIEGKYIGSIPKVW